jgi:hypothetical protein
MISSSSSEAAAFMQVAQENPCVGAVFASVRLCNELGVTSVDVPVLPEAAAEAIVLGIENSRLYELAATSRDEPPLDILDLYLRFCDDIGWNLEPSTSPGAWLSLAYSWSQLWLCGSLTPYTASERIWRLITRRIPESDLDPYLIFVALASDWEDFPESRTLLERQMEEHLQVFADRWEIG